MCAEMFYVNILFINISTDFDTETHWQGIKRKVHKKKKYIYIHTIHNIIICSKPYMIVF